MVAVRKLAEMTIAPGLQILAIGALSAAGAGRFPFFPAPSL